MQELFLRQGSLLSSVIQTTIVKLFGGGRLAIGTTVLEVHTAISVPFPKALN